MHGFMISRFWLLFLLVSLAKTDFQFFGGSISFSAISHNNTNDTEVRVDAISSWSLGDGPCGVGCNSTAINSTRSIKDKNVYTASFGSWSLEHGSGGVRVMTDINDMVLPNMTQTVIAVNENESYEQERILFSIALQWNGSRHTPQDIVYEGTGWHRFFTSVSLPWHLQAKLISGLRDDTGQPNSSPLSLFRPIYRVQLNKNTSIHIPAIDQEGDFTTCQPSKFVESGDLNFVLNGTTVNRNCVFEINAHEKLGYHDDYWLPVLVTIQDLGNHDITLGDEHYTSYLFSLSSTLIQFMVQVVDSLSGPEFVRPMASSVSRVLIWQEATWTTELQAKAGSGRQIREFRAVSRQGEQLLLSQPMDTSQPGVKSSWLSWKPTKQDVGCHIVCASATDNNGEMSPEDRCFIIEVIDLAARTSQQSISIPPLDVNTTLAAPINLQTNSEMASLAVTCEGVPVSECTISNATLVSSNPRHNYLTTIQVRPVAHGTVKVCVTSTLINGQKVDPLCFSTTVLPPDPCASLPCRNGATCSRSTTDVTDFQCQCSSATFFGKDCSQKIDLCDPDPCMHGKCYDMTNRYFCYCDRGFSGRNCDQDINDCIPDPCGGHGICIDGVNNYTCQCFPRYNGTGCNTDICPADPPNSTTCQKVVDPECAMDPCHGRGVCHPGPICICRFGFYGPFCQLNVTMPSTVTLVPLMVTNSSTINCVYNSTGTKPCTVRLFVNSPNGTPTLKLTNGTPSFVANSQVGPAQPVSIFGGRDLYSIDVIVDGNTTSQKGHFLCVDPSSATSKKAETCFNITYTIDPLTESKSAASLQQNASNRFEAPSLPDKSSLPCLVNTKCSILFYTSRTSGLCERIVTTDASLLVFEPIADSSRCVQEVAYQYPDAQNRTVCFQTGMTSFQTLCYNLEITNEIADPDCVPDPCNGRGVCHPGPSCICRFGFSGATCQQIVTMPSTLSLVPLMVTNGSTINCVYNNTATKPCTVRLFVNSPNGTPTMTVTNGTSSFVANSHVGLVQPASIFGVKDLHSVDVLVDGNTTSPKDNFLCVGPSQSASFIHRKVETCFNITYKTDSLAGGISLASLQHNENIRFETPSLPDKTSLPCPVNTKCSILFYTSRTSGKCERIITQDTSVSIFEPKPDNLSSQCVQEVAYQYSDVQTRTVCFQAGLTSFQTRCYDLEITAEDPSLSVTSSSRCLNGGSCEGTESVCRCACTFGFSGSRCEQEDIINDQTVWFIFLPIGMLVTLALLGCAIYCCLRKRDEKRKVESTR